MLNSCRYKELGTLSTVVIITDELSVGFNWIDSSDTTLDSVNLIWKSKTQSEPLPMWTPFKLDIAELGVKIFLLQSRDLDDLNGSGDKVYTHTLNLIEPFGFFNAITGSSFTHSFYTDQELINLSRTTQKTYKEVLDDALIKYEFKTEIIYNLNDDFFDFIAPEFNFKNLTLREVIEQIYGSAGRLPNVRVDDIANDRFILSAKQETTKEATTPNRFSLEKTLDSSQYYTGARATIDSGRLQESMFYPSRNGYVGITADSKLIKRKTPSFLKLPNNISTVEKIRLKHVGINYAPTLTLDWDEYNGQFFQSTEPIIRDYYEDGAPTSSGVDAPLPTDAFWDATDFVLEKQEWDGLDTSQRDDKLYYTRGNDKIEGFALDEDGLGVFGTLAFEEMVINTIFNEPSERVVSSSAFNSFQIVNGIKYAVYDQTYRIYDGGGAGSVDIEMYLMNIEYTPQFQGEYNTVRGQYKEKLVKTSIFNGQSVNFPNVDLSGQEQQTTIDLASNDKISIGEVTTTPLELTQEATGLGYCTKRSITVYKDQLVCKYDIDPIFKIIPSQVGVNNQPRLFQNDTSQLVDRHDIINEYLLFEKEDGGYKYTENSSLTSPAKNVIENTLTTTTTIGNVLDIEATAGIILADTNTQSAVGLQKFNAGKSFGFSYKIDSNQHLFGGTTIIDPVIGDNYLEQFPVQYTDDFARFNEILFNIFSDYTPTTLERAHNIPKAFGNFGVQYVDVRKTVIKDAQERWGQTYQLSCIGDGMKVYNNFAKRCLLYTGRIFDKKIIKLDSEPTGFENKLTGIESGSISLYNNEFTIDVFTQGWYAIVDDDNIPLIAIEAELFGTTKFKITGQLDNPFDLKTPLRTT